MLPMTSISDLGIWPKNILFSVCSMKKTPYSNIIWATISMYFSLAPKAVKSSRILSLTISPSKISLPFLSHKPVHWISLSVSIFANNVSALLRLTSCAVLLKKSTANNHKFCYYIRILSKIYLAFSTSFALLMMLRIGLAKFSVSLFQSSWQGSFAFKQYSSISSRACLYFSHFSEYSSHLVWWYSLACISQAKLSSATVALFNSSSHSAVLRASCLK